MANSLFSDQWYRVVGLKPRLRLNVRVSRQVIRDQVWVLLTAGSASKGQRLNAAAWFFIGRCDGQSTVDEVWQAMLAHQGDQVPTQDEVIVLLSQLYRSKLLDFDRAPHVELMIQQSRKDKRRETKARMNPLSFRVPLADPSRWLNRLEGSAQILFCGPAAWCFGLLMLVAGVIGLACWPELVVQAQRFTESARYAVLAWFMYPVMKFVHEASHGLAVKRWGGNVNEAGISLFLLMPLPYVDASQANTFVYRYQRAWVSAAGIAAELSLAAVGLLVWSISSPGLINDLALLVAIMGTVSSLLFNANPLMRLDGYFLLSDLIQIPNLATRSGQWWMAMIKRRLVKHYQAKVNPPEPGETRWLFLYSPLSWAYRLSLSVWLTLWAGSYHITLGLFVLIGSGGWMIGVPLTHAVKQFFADVPAGRTKSTLTAKLAGAAATALLVIGFVPVPDRLVTQGVVWVPDDAHIRVAESGFVKASLASHAAITKDTQVLELDDPALRTHLERLITRRNSAQSSLYQTLLTEPYKSQQIKQELAALDQEIAMTQQRMDQFVMRTPTAGKVFIYKQADLEGRFFKQGESVGLMLQDQVPLIRLVIAQDQRPLLTERAEVEVRFAQGGGAWGLGDRYLASIQRSSPGAIDRLPSAALSDRHGGTVPTKLADKNHLEPEQPMFSLDVMLQSDLAQQKAAQMIGARVWARIDLGYQPLAYQWWRELRTTVLHRFSPLES
jgi:putative peptide zinc metalloprotease protein